MPPATIAVVIEPETSSPWSSTRNTRSASPSKARPTSAPASSTRAWRSTRFSGWIGSAGWLGKVPSSSPYRISSSKGRPANTAGTTRPPMPLAVSATTFSGASRSRSTKVRTWAANSASSVLLGDACPWSAAGPTPATARSRISTRPVSSPTGRAPARQILMPLYCGRVVRGGEHGRRRVVAAGGEVDEVGGRQAEVDHVEALAADALGEGGGQLDARLGACRGRPAPDPRVEGSSATKAANAAPIARRSTASSWSGTVPRTS